MKKHAIAALFGLAMLGVSACDANDGPIEEAAEDVENTLEDAADEVEDAADDIKDEVEDGPGR